MHMCTENTSFHNTTHLSSHLCVDYSSRYLRQIMGKLKCPTLGHQKVCFNRVGPQRILGTFNASDEQSMSMYSSGGQKM